MSKSIFYYKQLTATEVGSKGTHEIYVRLPNEFDHNDFFQGELEENDTVLEKNFVAHNLTSGHKGEDVDLRFVYFHNSNKEKRIPSLGELFKANDVQENDVVRLESRISNGVPQFYITFLRANEINLSPKQFYYSVINDDVLLKKSTPSYNVNEALQQIYYGAPGTGKSHIIKEQTKGESVIRTTFHPDSDYSTFVGAYKPTTKEVILRDLSGHVVVENGQAVREEKIVYEFVNQAFLQAYVNAWKAYAEAQQGEAATPQYLVIEEINRGNCAQIFGDLFQLLDRNDSGFSDYPIKADNDMKKQLIKAFKGLDIPQRDSINALYDEADIVDKVLDGEVLLLPNNLYIWATMNTSDQSLFPIDSAFKRRWDWKYMPINNADKKWRIVVDGAEYDWWQFLTKVNEYVGSTTHSEDKKLGYFFCKPKNGKIDAETFVGKVIFYLWNDVFKDYGFEGTLFQAADGSTLTFDKFYGADANSINEQNVATFLKNLKVPVLEYIEEDEENKEQEETIVDPDYDKKEWREMHAKRYEFWTEFLNYAQNNDEFSKYFGGAKKATTDHWKYFYIRGEEFNLCVLQQRQRKAIEVEVYFDETNEVYHNLFAHKDEIENEMQVHYDWRELPDKKASKIVETKTGVDYDNKESWIEIFDFCIDRLLRMREVFPKYANK